MIFGRKVFVSTVTILFFAVLSFSLYIPTPVSAATGEWINAGNIAVNGETYTDVNPLDDNLNYKLSGEQGSCVSEIKSFSTGDIFNTAELGSATLFIKERDPLTGDCIESDPEEITLSVTDKSNDLFLWIDEDRLQEVSSSTIYTRLPGQDVFAEGVDDDCKNSVEVTDDNSGVFIVRGPQASGGNINCGEIRSNAVGFGSADNASIPPGQGSTGTPGEDQPSCERDGGSFTWLLCPALEGIDDIISYMDNQITTLLEVPDSYFNDQTIEQIWQRFRDLAYLLLIPTLLIMVIGTAAGFQLLDAYTVRRALPRLFIAAIFIALSLPLLRLLIDTVNVVGLGVYGLITSVVTDGGEFSLAGLFDPNATQGFAFSAGLVAGAVLYKVWIGFAFFLALSVFIGVATIFLLLAFRQLLIVALIVMAPLAILAWIFPGNDKPWKLWWGTFWKLLLLYPLVMALLAVGRVFAFIIDGVAPGGIIEVVLKLVAYIGPFFVIPAAFRYAGGAFANLAGIVNNRSKGPLDRLRGAGRKSFSERTQKANKSSLYSDRTALGRGLNTFTGAVGSPRRVGRSIGKGNLDALRGGRQSDRAVAGAANLKNDEVVQANQGDDNFWIALADIDLARTKLKQAEAKVLQNRQIKNDSSKTAQERYDAEIAMNGAQAEVDARQRGISNALDVKSRKTFATQAAAFQELNKTGYQYEYGEEGYKEMRQIASKIANGDEGTMSSLMSEGQYHAKNAQRFDLAGINFGAGYDLKSGLDKVGLYQLANAKKESLRAWVDTVPDTAPLVGKTLRDAAVLYKELEAMKANASGANRDEIVKKMKTLEDKGIVNLMKQPSDRKDPTTKKQAKKQGREMFDRVKAGRDVAYRNTFTTEEQTRGFRVIQVDETIADIAQNEARAYERPDPNRIEES